VVFRALYTRHFCRLHTLALAAAPSPSLLNLCAAFEALLHELEPALAFHLHQLGVQPLRVAFPWLLHAFVGHLNPDQVCAAKLIQSISPNAPNVLRSPCLHVVRFGTKEPSGQGLNQVQLLRGSMSERTDHETPMQVLLLWDRVVGFDSLLPLAVLATAVFSFRQHALRSARTMSEVMEVMEHINTLKVVPLLQHVLFTAPSA
jgi:hypothetical protein